MNKRTKNIIIAAMMAAIVCVATMAIKIPSPLGGYINIGDGLVLIAGWLLSPAYGFLASGIGAALADLLYGYVIYIPATFVIKGIMALVAFYGYKALSKKFNSIISRIISAVAVELVMSVGYYVYEGFLYGFVASLVNMPANAIQGALGIVIGVLLIRVLEKNKIKLN